MSPREVYSRSPSLKDSSGRQNAYFRTVDAGIDFSIAASRIARNRGGGGLHCSLRGVVPDQISRRDLAVVVPWSRRSPDHRLDYHPAYASACPRSEPPRKAPVNGRTHEPRNLHLPSNPGSVQIFRGSAHRRDFTISAADTMGGRRHRAPPRRGSRNTAGPPCHTCQRPASSRVVRLKSGR